MLPPVKCFTCGKPLSMNLYDEFNALKKERNPKNEESQKVGVITYTHDVSYLDFFEKHQIRRICCRSMLTTAIRLDDKIA
jgi:DNA-directed RNA polymerase subunit N (RpoN/RPB10)